MVTLAEGRAELREVVERVLLPSSSLNPATNDGPAPNVTRPSGTPPSGTTTGTDRPRVFHSALSLEVLRTALRIHLGLGRSLTPGYDAVDARVEAARVRLFDGIRALCAFCHIFDPRRKHEALAAAREALCDALAWLLVVLSESDALVLETSTSPASPRIRADVRPDLVAAVSSLEAELLPGIGALSRRMEKRK